MQFAPLDKTIPVIVLNKISNVEEVSNLFDFPDFSS